MGVSKSALVYGFVELPSRFQSTLPVWGATSSPSRARFRATLFQSTLPVWGATLPRPLAVTLLVISIHAPRVGSDGSTSSQAITRANFNPRSPCGERLSRTGCLCVMSCISIHAPRVGSDSLHAEERDRRFYFNPRSPCGERHDLRLTFSSMVKFQSTLPVWGATVALARVCVARHISIHAPRVGSDRRGRRDLHIPTNFNPRSPCGERRRTRMRRRCEPYFNPRSPCGERPWRRPRGRGRSHFNPRSPCGERPSALRSTFLGPTFQSTLPVWGATLRTWAAEANERISIHAPRVGSDARDQANCRAAFPFQSTLPVWGATRADTLLAQYLAISIHAPRVGSDSPFSPSRSAAVYFNPRSPCGERPRRRCTASLAPQFQSTLPVWGATGRSGA